MNITDRFITGLVCFSLAIYVVVFFLGKVYKKTVGYISMLNVATALLIVLFLLTCMFKPGFFADALLYISIIVVELLVMGLSFFAINRKPLPGYLKALTFIFFSIHFLMLLGFFIFMLTFKINRLF